jgi:hypothetical protein
MNFLNAFFHGEALAEILMEGHNPYALKKLEAADVDALRDSLRAGEALLGYAVGRIVMSGRGVWAVTNESVLLRNVRHHGVVSVPLTQVAGFEAVRGRFGHTVRLRVQDRAWSLFGADRELARSMHLAFQARGVTSQFEDKPARSHRWEVVNTASVGAQDCLQDARARLQAT